MNENQNDPNSNIAFNTNPDTQASTNPFTGDLKGEFSSDFGTNTNAVSQIFKSSGFSSENRTKYIAIGMLLLLALGGIAYFMTGEDSADPFGDDFATDGFDDPLLEDEFAEDLAGDPMAPAEEGMAPMEEGMMEQDMAPAESMMATGNIVLLAPENGARQTYDETTGPAEFSWEGPADRIVFSRSSSMQPVTMAINLGGAMSYALENPYPGTWYWQVENASGASEVRSFRIMPPERRNFPVTQPTPGSAVSGNGGVVAWQAGEKIARYSVEIVPAGQSFASPQYRFGTSGTSVSLNGVAPGSYDFRVGAFSEVAGRWEWQVIRNVTVQ